MKPKDKERLVRCRPVLVRLLDVNTVLPPLLSDNSFSKKDNSAIYQDSRRRERVIKFLDILEKKKTEVYQKFLDILSESLPHVFLMLSESDWDEDTVHTPSGAVASCAHLDDEWGVIHEARPHLIREIDANNLLAYLRTNDVIDDDEVKLVQGEKSRERGIEALLDILEMKPLGFVNVFLDSLSDVYPHLYLALTEGAKEDDDDDDDDLL